MIAQVARVILLATIQIGSLTANNFYTYFCANYAECKGNYSNTQRLYNQMLKDNPSIYVYKGYIPFLFGINDHKAIVNLIPTLDTTFTSDPDIQQLFALSLEKLGNQQESDARFIVLNNQFKDNQVIAFKTATIFLQRKENENALATIDNFLNSSPKKSNNFIFYFLKAQIYVQLNNLEKALDSITTCLKLHPQFDKGWLLFALLNEQAGKLTDAVQGYSTFLELAGDNKEVAQRLIQLKMKL